MVPDDPEVAELLDVVGTTVELTADEVEDPDAIRRALAEQHRRDLMA